MAFYGDNQMKAQSASPLMEHMKRNTVAYRLCQRSEGMSYFIAALFTNLIVKARYQSGNLRSIKIRDINVDYKGVITAKLEGV